MKIKCRRLLRNTFSSLVGFGLARTGIKAVHSQESPVLISDNDLTQGGFFKRILYPEVPVSTVFPGLDKSGLTIPQLASMLIGLGQQVTPSFKHPSIASDTQYLQKIDQILLILSENVRSRRAESSL